jgi:hypothetical protein
MSAMPVILPTTPIVLTSSSSFYKRKVFLQNGDIRHFRNDGNCTQGNVTTQLIRPQSQHSP